MSKIIQDPQRLIDAFAKSFGEDYRETFENVFSQYISDAVIAVTVEDIAAQAIAWANSCQDFNCYFAEIDIDVDANWYAFMHNSLLDNLDTRFICDYIEEKWDANATTSGEAIDEALLERYTEEDLLNLILAIASDYNEANINE